jgi:hypothetical protein
MLTSQLQREGEHAQTERTARHQTTTRREARPNNHHKDRKGGHTRNRKGGQCPTPKQKEESTCPQPPQKEKEDKAHTHPKRRRTVRQQTTPKREEGHPQKEGLARLKWSRVLCEL